MLHASEQMKWRTRNGYTFIELTVVLVIIMTVAAVGVPRLVSWVNEGNLGAASRRLAGTIRYVRNEAARRQKSFFLTIDIEENAYWIEVRRDPSEIEHRGYYTSWGDPEDENFEPFEDEFVTRRELRRRIVFSQVNDETYGKFRIEFRADGTTQDVAIYLQSTEERVATVTLDADTGRVEIYDYLFEPEPKPTLYEQYDLDE